MTRSVPFTMNVPCRVISGISPKYTSCSFTFLIERTPLSGSTSQMTSWTVTLSGAA